MAKLDIDWLKVFVEVHRTQSVTRAAERLGIAQANASVALGKLRRHFNDPLFARTSRGMEPTPFAQQIEPDITASLERLLRLAGTPRRFEAAASDRRFRIGMTDISEIVVLQVSSFLGVARLVAGTELLVVVPRRLGQAQAQQEKVRLLAPPLALPAYAVKQHWHERFHADAGHAWLRQTVAEVLRG